jgi:hypothetical protein
VPTPILYRNNLDDRSDFSQGLASLPIPFNWDDMENRIEASGAQKNLYPWTEGFLSQTSFTHLRVALKSSVATPSTLILLESRYGPLETEGSSSTWTMVDQFSPQTTFEAAEWISTAALSPDVRALVCRIRDGNVWRHRYVGIKKDSVIWDLSTEVGNLDYLLHDVHYGNYSSDPAPHQIGMLKYFEINDRTRGRIEMWVVDASFTEAPKEATSIWQTTGTLRCVHLQFARSEHLNR